MQDSKFKNNNIFNPFRIIPASTIADITITETTNILSDLSVHVFMFYPILNSDVYPRYTMYQLNIE